MIVNGFVDNLTRFINIHLVMFTLVDHVEPATQGPVVRNGWLSSIESHTWLPSSN